MSTAFSIETAVEPHNKNKPLVAWLTVNRRCNFRCVWCYAQGTKFSKEEEMPLSLAMAITRLLTAAGVRHLFITGGEPTLWQPLIKFNAFCHEIGLSTTIVTNAMRFGDDKYWNRYLEHPNTCVGVSLKASSPKELWGTAKVRRFGEVTKGITRAMNHFRSGVGIVYNTYCVDSMVEMSKYAMDCGAQSVKIDFCTPVLIDGEPSPISVVDPSVMVPCILRDYPQLEDITGGNIAFIMSIPFCFWPKEFVQELKSKNRIESVCQLLRREGLVVGHDGSVFMCNELFDFPIGKYPNNFNTAESLIEFLNSDEIDGYYNELSRYPSDRCETCAWYQDCGGGCPLQWTFFSPERLIHPVG